MSSKNVLIIIDDGIVENVIGSDGDYTWDTLDLTDGSTSWNYKLMLVNGENEYRKTLCTAHAGQYRSYIVDVVDFNTEEECELCRKEGYLE